MMLKQKFIVQYGSMAITQIVSMVTGIIVARLAGPSVMGMIAYGTSYVSLLGFINNIFVAFILIILFLFITQRYKK